MALDQPDPGLDIELVTASLRADASDLGAFVEALAVKLEQALPNGVRVDRRGGLFGAKKVRQISVDAGDTRLRLDRDGAAVDTSRARLSGGIVLKTERVEIDEWLRELGRALAEQARRSAVTREALERMLNQ
ncbi:MAG TPA: hypothetical protein VFW09_07690 [Solirubrobacteraceae bacterium]|jgi:hypothetical protein|nr:hypothetical protein [Solirubrobacteraceae bacterium]